MLKRRFLWRAREVFRSERRCVNISREWYGVEEKFIQI